jgi:hypothetical protein
MPMQVISETVFATYLPGDLLMGFFTGRATFLRFRVDGASPGMFGPEHLDKLSAHAIGKQRTAEKDGVEAGWIAGDDILDVGFDMAKNVVEDALHFSLRVDTQKLPADLLRCYARAELQALAAANPSGRPSAKQKKEARETAREKLEAEAQDERYLRRKAYPLLWDARANHLLVGTTSATVLDRVLNVFKDTFGSGLTLLDAGRMAESGLHAHALADTRSSIFIPGNGAAEVAWVNDAASHAYLGNEFLLWLWFVLETIGDTVTLGDGSEVVVMLARTLLLDCPRALSGNETIRSECPTKLPEARRAIQSGKLPRQAGLILVRHDRQYELTLHAETLAVGGAKLPAAEEREDRARQEERVGQLRHLTETLDLLYDAFLKRRLEAGWPRELEQLQRWLQRDEKPRQRTSSTLAACCLREQDRSRTRRPAEVIDGGDSHWSVMSSARWRRPPFRSTRKRHVAIHPAIPWSTASGPVADSRRRATPRLHPSRPSRSPAPSCRKWS